MKKIQIHPSIMCADHSSLEQEIHALTNEGIDYFHMDVMDGNYVPNFGCGPGLFKCIKKHSSVPLDVHLMITEPARHIQYFRDLGAEIITIHPDAGLHPARTLMAIADLGAIPGLALNPGTSIESVKELLPLCQHVLVMTVNPGFAGQRFLDFTMDKIRLLGELSKKYGFTICIDGGADTEKIRMLRPLGVDAYVVGSSIFNYNLSEYGRIINELRLSK